jgi:hypothetical protein
VNQNQRFAGVEDIAATIRLAAAEAAQKAIKTAKKAVDDTAT